MSMGKADEIYSMRCSIVRNNRDWIQTLDTDDRRRLRNVLNVS